MALRFGTGPAQSTSPWWTMDPGPARANAVLQAVERIEAACRSRRAEDVLHMRLYGNRDVAGMGPQVNWRSSDRGRLRYNLAQAICDALQAKIAKLRPRPRFLTERGKWSERKRAQAMEQAVDGEFYRNDVDELGPQCALDGFIVGTGVAHVGRDGCGYPFVERTAPGELLVDPRDGFHGDPQTLYHLRLLDRDKVRTRFGGDRGSLQDIAIRDTSMDKRIAFPFLPSRDTTIDQIIVIEAYRLPSGHDSRDGLHVQVIPDLELDWGQWERDRFPYSVYRWQRRQFGFWGRGAIEEIRPMQVEINHTLEKIQYILHNVSTVRHWIQAGGKIDLKPQKMTNSPGEVLRFWGPNPPITDVVNAVPRELFDHVDRQIARGFSQVGLSEMSATSTKPSGLDSGEAIRAFQDVGTERFVLNGRDYERFHMDIAANVIHEKNAIAQDPAEPDVEVMAEVRGRTLGTTVRTIKWGDVKLEPERYIMQILPQSALPGTPVGRIATVESWLKAGLVTPEEGKELLDFPDIQEHQSLAHATRDAILYAVETMIEADEGDADAYADAYVPPDPLIDLDLAEQLVTASYHRFTWEGAPEANLEHLTRYLADIDHMRQDALAQQQAAAQPQPQVPGPPQQPMAAPMGFGGPQPIGQA